MAGNILEKFFIQFESDAKPLKDGISEANTQARKVEQSLTSVDQLANKVGHSFRETIMSVSKGFLGFFALEKIGESIHSVAEYADQIGKLSKATGVSTEDLSAWGQAIEQENGSIAEFEGTVERMSAQLADFATKGKSRAAPFFKELGVAMTDSRGKARSFIDILPELADKFSKMGKGEALGVGEKLGLDRGTISLLQKGRMEVEKAIKRQKELGVITGNQADVAEDFNDRMSDFGIILKKVFLEISEIVLPIITTFLKGIVSLNHFIKENASIIVGSLIPALVLLSVILIGRVVTALKAVNWALAVASATPIVLIIAAFLALSAAVGLVVQDFYYFFTGQKSMLGGLMKKYPAFGAVVKALGVIIKANWEFIKSIFFGIGDALRFLTLMFVAPEQAWRKLFTVFKTTWNWFASAFPNAANIIKNVFLSVANVIKFVWGAISKSIDFVISGILKGINAVEGAYDKVKSVFKGDGKVNIESVNKNLAQPAQMPFGNLKTALSGGTSVMKNSNVNIGKVEVRTQATDATGISKQIGDTLHAQMRQAVNRFDDGIAA